MITLKELEKYDPKIQDEWKGKGAFPRYEWEPWQSPNLEVK